MNVEAQMPVFHMESTTGFCSMSELWHAGLFIGDVLKWKIIIDGVTHVSPVEGGVYADAPPVGGASDNGGQNVTPARPQYEFRRKRGVAKFSELEDFSAWLLENLRAKIASSDFTQVSNDSSGERVAFRS